MTKLDGLKFVVTGGAGFLGSFVMDKLGERGYKKIFALDPKSLICGRVTTSTAFTDKRIQM
jgi:nucleoside-diphosphate-sugar epimerase